MALAKQRRWLDAEPLLINYAMALQAKSGAEGDFGKVARLLVDMYSAGQQPAKAAEWRNKLASNADHK
jgi:hypothetical protein